MGRTALGGVGFMPADLAVVGAASDGMPRRSRLPRRGDDGLAGDRERQG
jgi:hypothetical protein